MLGNDGQAGSGADIVYTTAYAAGRGRAVHETTNGTITLCGREVNPGKTAPRIVQEGEECAWCRVLRMRGHASPSKPNAARGGNRAGAAGAGAQRSTLEAKVAELERLAAEVADLRDQVRAKAKRCQELRDEVQHILGGIEVAD